MKLKITMSIQYPPTPPTENRPYGTTNIEDRYEQTVEVASEEHAKKVVESVIKAFNSFAP